MEARKSVIVAVVGLLVVTSAACRKKAPVAGAAPGSHDCRIRSRPEPD